MKINFLLISFLLLFSTVYSQNRIINGIIKDKTTNEPLPGVNVVAKGNSIGTSTNSEGKFTLAVPSDAISLIASFVGYGTQEVSVQHVNEIVINLEPSIAELAEVVISVGRGSNRTITDTPLPVDNITISDLRSSGQLTFDKTLQYRVPSFNTVNTPVNDATSLFDPYEIRNLGPSRTLILINGKRKNLTSLVYTQTSPGRGETGSDLSAIPIDAIKRIEILRDGASAQYGSDAIAGVMNIILKDSYDYTSATFNTGSTIRYGGFQYNFNYNSGANFGKNGFLNYHLSFTNQQAANRKDKIDVDGDISGLTNGTPNDEDAVRRFLAKYPDGFNKNGSPENKTAKFLVNAVIPVVAKSEVYFNAAYVFRKSISNANYRQPYWRIDRGLLHRPTPGEPDYTADDYSAGWRGEVDPNDFATEKAAGLYQGYLGYQPTFEGDLHDYHTSFGFRSEDIGGWKQDMSITAGGNKMLFTVNNTVNASFGNNSPVSFKPGGFAFNHVVGNMDFSKSIATNLYLTLGSEFRNESWELLAGDTASYQGAGANSFPGFPERNAIKASRTNIGLYADIVWDITESFLLGGTFRHENYSDFGNANVYKITSRYKVGEVATLRASFSTGFRAPTLHQQYLSLNQASFANGTIVITGLANNLSREARLLGVPKLKAEKSQNLTMGFGLNPTTNLSLTVDYYSINIDDRIVYSNEVSNTMANVSSVSFFINAAQTKTSGLDMVTTYKNLMLGSTKLNVSLAGNYTIQNELVGGFQAVNNTVPLTLDANQSIYNQTQESLMTTSRPKYKFILGADAFIQNFTINFNNTLFGPSTFNNADLSQDLKLVFIPKIVSDISVSYAATSNLNLTLSVQNLLNVMPAFRLKALNELGEEILRNAEEYNNQINAITFAGRYPVLTYDGSHFSQFGASYNLQVLYKF